MRQILFQKAAVILLWNTTKVFTNCVSFLLQNVAALLEIRHLLRNATILLQNATIVYQLHCYNHWKVWEKMLNKFKFDKKCNVWSFIIFCWNLSQRKSYIKIGLKVALYASLKLNGSVYLGSRNFVDGEKKYISMKNVLECTESVKKMLKVLFNFC